MVKSQDQILKAFKKSNKVRRQRMAERAGYKTADDYRAHLQGGKVTVTPINPPSNPVNNGDSKPTIHIVSILDASSSMEGGKFNNALLGLQNELKELKENTEINYLTTFCYFSYPSDIVIPHFRQFVKDVNSINARCYGNTALYDAIGQILTRVKNTTQPGEKVLINITTDGEENSSREWNRSSVAKLIKECETLGFTVTFVGTERDVKEVVRNLNVDYSNTLVHDNTSQGVADSFNTRSMATKSYSAKVLNNEDVLTGFYKTNETL
jgi:uncharacterized protein YegL